MQEASRRRAWIRWVANTAARGCSAPLRAVVGVGRALAGRASGGWVVGVLRSAVAFSGLLYPVRPDVIETIGRPFTADPALENAWGGPTLIGAWLVHALVAVLVQAAALPLARGMVRLQDRLLRERITPKPE